MQLFSFRPVLRASLAAAALLVTAPATATFKVIEAQTLDADGTVVVWDGNDTYTPTSINNYVTRFSYLDGGGQRHDVETTRFAAFIPTLSGIDQVVQPAGTGPNPIFSNPADYLTAGTGGLSTSTGINMVASTTSSQDIFFDVTKAIYGSGNDDILLLADVADNQSEDAINLLNGSGQVLRSYTLKSTDWWVMGTQTIDRVEFPSGGYASRGERDTRKFSLAALSWSDFGVTSQADLDAVARLEFIIPASRVDPRTDYGFLAANTEFLSSPELTPPVPTPVSWVLILPGLVWLAGSGARRHRRRAACRDCSARANPAP